MAEDLFGIGSTNFPLAQRMRPKTLRDFYGQEHLVGSGKILEQAVKSGNLFSAILWGPPGSGKTTLAQILAAETGINFINISAVTATVADMRKHIEKAADDLRFYSKKTLLFVDEIHRFSKSQQDVLLPHVETGTVILIGATTENPSFEVIGPLLSRSRVLVLEPILPEHLKEIIGNALKNKELGLGKLKLKISKDAQDALIGASNGDARFALTTLEIASGLVKAGGTIGREQIVSAMQRKMPSYDKKADSHYDTISPFIKSMRGGKTDAALHYLARMIDAGEDPKFIARRMVIFASEDIGMRDPHALLLANAVFRAVEIIGYPEAGINLSHGVVYLSKAPKTKAVYYAYLAAMEDAKKEGNLPIPLKIRNAPTKLMKDLGYGEGYEKYTNDDLLPEKLKGKKYFEDK